jgi:hypothetical protein
VVPIAVVIITALFFVQRQGTAGVGRDLRAGDHHLVLASRSSA